MGRTEIKIVEVVQLKKSIYRLTLSLSILGILFLAGNFLIETNAAENDAQNKSISQKNGKPTTPLESKEDIAPVKLETVPSEDIQISLHLEKKGISHITGEAKSIITEKRPGGYLIETWYPTNTENGDLLVTQSVNIYGNVKDFVELTKTWYPQDRGGSQKLDLSGYTAILYENEVNANTLHIITNEHVYTAAGQKTDFLLEVGKEIVKDLPLM